MATNSQRENVTFSVNDSQSMSPLAFRARSDRLKGLGNAHYTNEAQHQQPQVNDKSAAEQDTDKAVDADAATAQTDDTAKPSQEQIAKGGNVGVDPIRTMFFGNFFRAWLKTEYVEDIAIYNHITDKCSEAVRKVLGFNLVKVAAFASVAFGAVSAQSITTWFGNAIDIKSLGLDYEAAEQLAFVAMDSPMFGVALIGSLLLIAAWGGMGTATNLVSQGLEKDETHLKNDISGEAGRLFNASAQQLDSIYVQQGDRPVDDDQHFDSWPSVAKEKFSDGHRKARRLEFLEMYTLTELRRTYRTFWAITIIGQIALLSVFAATIWILYQTMFTAAPVASLASVVILGAGFAIVETVGSLKGLDGFASSVHESLDDWHSFKNFGLKERTGEIIRRDQLRMMELMSGAFRRR